MRDVPQPLQNPMADDAGLPTRPWVMYFNWVYRKLRELAAAVTALQSGGGGGSVLPDEYRVLDPATVAASGNFGTLDYTAYNGITLDLVVDTTMVITDPVILGTAGTTELNGKRLTLMLTFNTSGSIAIFGVRIAAPSLGNMSGSIYKAGTLEWRFNEAGNAFVTFVWLGGA